ncbi:AAA-domain-containing protein [Hymenopellis radicata]|nr:AAA-domain-containing protein [Hymenopellis radicata]
MNPDSPENDANPSPTNSSPLKITLKVPAMANTRSSARLSGSRSGSQQSESNSRNGRDGAGEEDDHPPVRTRSTRSGRAKPVSYVESDPDDGPIDDDGAAADAAAMFDGDDNVEPAHADTHDADADEDDELQPRRSSSRRRLTKRENSNLDDFIEEDDTNVKRYNTRHSQAKQKPKPDPRILRTQARADRAMKRASMKDGDYVRSSSGESSHNSEELHFSDEIDDREMDHPIPDDEEDEPEEEEGKGYKLRQRAPVNYAIPPPLEEMPRPPPKSNNRGGGRKPFHRKRGPGWSAGGAELGRWMGLPGDDSDSDGPTRTPKKPFSLGAGAFDGGGVAAGGSGLLPPDFAASGTPSNLGKVTDASLADADPLGVNVNVTFDEVGGLDDHIHSLKEMTLLPLLYPEVFQQFNVTPPRGVLFHGPPGTGKTLLARALAASCRSNGKQISFFMRKGADALSKWVGEAERQLRLLFEEARASQPSIIFFDEIDGLAPVRSSKQDQIHASIVSTLLALMDGMDGRGQVVVIGATNRPDAIDPALRRPGRFDREFYFPLPNLEGREKILSIMTKSWQGWTGDEGDNKLKGLAKMTKGYGGADLRALCTEATLNAIQRKYPQIYKSNDRLLLKPDSITVGLRDFMISIKKLVPSSARSSASVATPLPPQFEPLLSDTLEKAKTVLERVLPTEKRLTALEEAEFEDEDDETVALDRELLMQSMETLRVHRPRILLYGPRGMGQTYIGAAMLHHLEGYHVQSLELGTLLGDSTRTVEAAIVQLFVEAKRHQPSIIYIPSLIGWCATVSETARSTVKAMLDTLAPTDPILLLAIIDGQFKDLPRDVRSWFGPSKDNRVELAAPTDELRERFFEGLIKDIRRPPNQFTDGIKRRKRVLEVLPIAPPLEPRKPTPAELAAQAQNDQRIITLLKFRLGPILTELKRKNKRFTKRATDEYTFDVAPAYLHTLQITDVQMTEDGPMQSMVQEQVVEPMVNGHVNGLAPPAATSATAPEMTMPQLYDMDLERMHSELYKDRYLTPQQFLEDVGKIVYNAKIREYEDHDRLLKAQHMYNAAEVSLQDFDPQFRMECERMAAREKKRREELKKDSEARDKGKEPEVEVVARRSTRQNGLAPELVLTDPVKLERRLKRQREGLPTDSNASDSDSREAKRSRMLGEVDGDADADADADADPDIDPLDTLRPTVHFADQLPPHHMQHSQSYPSQQAFPPTFNSHSNGQGGSMNVNSLLNHSPTQNPASGGYGYDAYAPSSSHQAIPPIPPDSYMGSQPAGPSSYGAGSNYNQYSMHSQPQQPYQQLHPQPQPYDRPPPQPSYTQMHSHPYQSPAPPDLRRTPSLPHDGQPMVNGFAQHVDPDDPFVDRQPAESSSSGAMAVDEPQEARSKSKSPEAPPREPTPPLPPPPPPRTPTPLPDFHVDEGLLSQLQGSLRGNTSSLNVEQLEQLRATCLGAVWRKRSEWDRDTLVRELQDLVGDFVEEVGMNDDDGDEDETM